MPNGKGSPDCHYCAHHRFVDGEVAKTNETIPNDIPGRYLSTAATAPFCSLWNVALPLLDSECRICSDYWSAGEGRVTSTKEFFDRFSIDPRRGILYRYFYNDTWIEECMSLEGPNSSAHTDSGGDSK